MLRYYLQPSINDYFKKAIENDELFNSQIDGRDYNNE